MLRLEINTRSSLMLGSGSGRGSYIDSDIIFNHYGIPIFPARRLKGLLRESAVEVLEMLEQAGLKEFVPWTIEEIFGSSTNRSAIRLHNLYLDDYKATLECLKYSKQEFPHIVNKEAVMNAVTDIRQQTAINDEGIARENSLRTIRVLNPGFQFKGPIEILESEWQEDIEALLALACLNLKRVGSGRNRGWGEISCRLYSDNGVDLGQKVLGLLEQWDKNSSSGRRLEKEEKTNSERSVDEIPTAHTAFTHKLEYRITNLSPLLFTAPGSDENMVTSFDYIPGSALQGFFANRLIKQKKIDPAIAQTDFTFKQWFLDEALCFSNAYLVYNEADYAKYPLYPTPLFLHTDKQKQKIYNLIKNDEDTKAIGGYCCLVDGEIQKKEAEKVINFHLVRNSNSGSEGERIEGHGEDGGIFHYEALKQEQEFHGYIFGSEENLYTFLDLFGIDSKMAIYLGRSLSTQYGTAQIEFTPIIKNEPSIDDDLLGEEDTSNYLNYRQVVLYLLSPLVLNNLQGYPAVSEQELITYLESSLDVKGIEIEKSFARVEKRNAFVSHWKMYESSFRCWVAGSSFLLKFKQDIDQEIEGKLTLLMQEGLGERCSQGYGQVRFIRHILPDINGFYDESNIHKNYKKPERLSAWAKETLDQIKEKRLKRMIIATAAQRARKYYDGNSTLTLSSNLLGRLETIVSASINQDDLGEKIKKLRETAQKPLKEMRIGEQTLYNDLIALRLEVWCKEALDRQWESFATFTNFLDSQKDLDNSLKDYKLYKLYWQVFLRTLRKLNKHSVDQKEGE